MFAIIHAVRTTVIPFTDEAAFESQDEGLNPRSSALNFETIDFPFRSRSRAFILRYYTPTLDQLISVTDEDNVFSSGRGLFFWRFATHKRLSLFSEKTNCASYSYDSIFFGKKTIPNVPFNEGSARSTILLSEELPENTENDETSCQISSFQTDSLSDSQISSLAISEIQKSNEKITKSTEFDVSESSKKAIEFTKSTTNEDNTISCEFGNAHKIITSPKPIVKFVSNQITSIYDSELPQFTTDEVNCALYDAVPLLTEHNERISTRLNKGELQTEKDPFDSLTANSRDAYRYTTVYVQQLMKTFHRENAARTSSSNLKKKVTKKNWFVRTYRTMRSFFSLKKRKRYSSKNLATFDRENESAAPKNEFILPSSQKPCSITNDDKVNDGVPSAKVELKRFDSSVWIANANDFEFDNKTVYDEPYGGPDSDNGTVYEEPYESSDSDNKTIYDKQYESPDSDNKTVCDKLIRVSRFYHY